MADEKVQDVQEDKVIPHPFISIIPILVLVAMIMLSMHLFDTDTMASGANQLSLIIASATCAALSMAIYRVPWKALESAMVVTISTSSVSIVILLLIGMMSASWMVSGVVPTFIYYGVQLMSPDYFLVSSCIICALISVVTGSSWTTIATMGVAMLGVGNALGISVPLTAGAIISGAYFGDKISPLSDTTVLASSAAGVDIFDHIRYMLRTTIPTFVVSLILFFVAGLFFVEKGVADTALYTTVLSTHFNVSLWTLLVPLATILLIAKKVSSIITLLLSSLFAGIMAAILQPDILVSIANGTTADALTLMKGIMHTYFSSTSVDMGNDTITDLVATGGMSGMLDTVWLILCAMCFGGIMMESRMLMSLTNAILKMVSGVTSLVACTASTGIVFNLVTSDQYMSVVLTADMYKRVYDERGCERRLLSRTAEDGATVTSVLIPWNTCGMTQASILGVATIAYLPFCFFNYLSPLMTILMSRWVKADTAKFIKGE